MNARESAQLIEMLIHLWPLIPEVRTGFKDDQSKVWATVLADIDYTEAEVVVIEHARTGAQFPLQPGTVAERVLTMREKATGTYAPDVDQALTEVSAAIRQGGVNLLDPKRTVGGVPARHEWSHPAIGAAVRAIGWRELCMSDRPDVVRAQFTKAYEAARARLVAEQRRLPVTRRVMSLIAGTSVPALPTGESNAQRTSPAKRKPRAV